MKPRATGLFTLAALCAAAAGGGQVAASQAAGRTVKLRDIAFSPQHLSIAARP